MSNTPFQPTAGETTHWTGARDIVHFVGVCGAGKTTLATLLAARCTSHGGKTIGTIDWDPHTADSDRQSERAFSREFDRISNGGNDPDIHAKIVRHSIGLINAWRRSDANLVLVDRWYESYDNLPAECLSSIELALSKSGFRVTIVNLLVTSQGGETEFEAMRERLAHTRGHRPANWWTPGMGTLDEMAHSECAYQENYQDFCHRSPFAQIRLATTDMDWQRCADVITGRIGSAGDQVKRHARPWSAYRSGMSAPNLQVFKP